MIVKILGTIDIIAAIVIMFLPIWKPLKLILVFKLLYTGAISWSNIFNE